MAGCSHRLHRVSDRCDYCQEVLGALPRTWAPAAQADQPAPGPAQGVQRSPLHSSEWTQVAGEDRRRLELCIPGMAPFLLSRKVLQGMEAKIDLKANTMGGDLRGLARNRKEASKVREVSCVASIDRERHFHAIISTPDTIKLTSHRCTLRMLFGEDWTLPCVHTGRAVKGFRSKQAPSHCQMSPDGTLNISPLSLRPASARRASFDRQGAGERFRGPLPENHKPLSLRRQVAVLTAVMLWASRHLTQTVSACAAESLGSHGH